MTAPDFLDRQPRPRLAYHSLRAKGDGGVKPGVVFLGGFGSDMTGTKAVFLEDWARARGRAFLRFDYSGHGQSEGRFEDGCISDWAEDAREAVAALTRGPQVVVGSSMGGWIAMLLARAEPERLAAFVGIAAAPDFTRRIEAEMTDDQRAGMATHGRIPHWDPLVITRRLIEDGRTASVLDRPLTLDCPVRLLHGMADEDVPHTVALDILAHIDCPDARATLVKGSGHRFSEPQDLELLSDTLDALDTPVPAAG